MKSKWYAREPGATILLSILFLLIFVILIIYFSKQKNNVSVSADTSSAPVSSALESAPEPVASMQKVESSKPRNFQPQMKNSDIKSDDSTNTKNIRSTTSYKEGLRRLAMKLGPDGTGKCFAAHIAMIKLSSIEPKEVRELNDALGTIIEDVDADLTGNGVSKETLKQSYTYWLKTDIVTNGDAATDAFVECENAIKQSWNLGN